MAPTVEITLEQMAKMALGGHQLTTMNVSVLHSLINLLLKKLNCYDEKVSISGMEAKCLQKLLKTSQPAPLLFDDQKIDIITTKLDRLVHLEKHIADTRAKLNCHFDQIEKSNAMADIKLEITNWERFKQEAENHCISCHKDNELACNLIRNVDFVKKLQRRMTLPMIERLFELEKKIEYIREDLIEFIQMAEEHYKKIALVNGCLDHLNELRDRININYLKFLGAMEEVQDSIDIKADKMYVPALKKFVSKSLNRMAILVKDVQTYRDCPKPPGTITEGVRCMSCGDKNVCADVGVHVVSMQPNAVPFKPMPLPKVCDCLRKVSAFTEDMPQKFPTHVLSLNLIPEKPQKPQAAKSRCTSNVTQLKLLEGFDGNLYRKG